MHTQNRPISNIFLLPLHLFEMGNDSWGVKNFEKYSFSYFLGSKNGVFYLPPSNEKSLKNKKLLPIHRTEWRK